MESWAIHSTIYSPCVMLNIPLFNKMTSHSKSHVNYISKDREHGLKWNTLYTLRNLYPNGVNIEFSNFKEYLSITPLLPLPLTPVCTHFSHHPSHPAQLPSFLYVHLSPFPIPFYLSPATMSLLSALYFDTLPYQTVFSHFLL